MEPIDIYRETFQKLERSEKYVEARLEAIKLLRSGKLDEYKKLSAAQGWTPAERPVEKPAEASAAPEASKAPEAPKAKSPQKRAASAAQPKRTVWTGGWVLKGSTSSAPVKYRSPDGETWSGRGRKPRWLVEAVKKGYDLESLRVSD